MGRLDRLRRKKKHCKHHRKGQGRRPRAADSDPEPSGAPFLRAEEQDTSCTNSCDETLNLCGSTLTSDFQRPPADKCQSEAAHHIASDAMEVTRRLSCLNFSMLPQSPLTPAAGYTATTVSSPVAGREMQRDLDVLSDLELFSEMTSATQLPTLSDREAEGMEGVESYHRQGRKRPSRRKTNRRSKKFRYINSQDGLSASRGHKNAVMTGPLPVGVVRTSSRETPGSSHCGGVARKEGGGTTHMLSRARSFRRAKRLQHGFDDDPLQCYFSDTSVVLERDTSPILDLEGEEDMFETTPPAMEETFTEQMCDDALPSELSETTSDSGCEGDDEESSVEGPAGATPIMHRSGPLFPCSTPTRALLGGSWWGARSDDISSLGDQKLQQILSGSFPLLTAEGRQKMEQVCGSLVEFKHPGQLRMYGGPNTGRKKRRKPRELVSPLTLKDINQKIVKYVQEPSSDDTELKFNLVSRALCKTISSLAQVYHLECLIQQKRRLPVASPVLHKTPHTRLASKEEIEPILRRHGQQEGLAGVLLSTGMNVHSKTNPHKPQPSRSNPQPVPMVGGASQALDERNIGNRMLRGMGWRPGTGLGAEGDGIKSPVKAYIRSRHTGLGYT